MLTFENHRRSPPTSAASAVHCAFRRSY